MPCIEASGRHSPGVSLALGCIHRCISREAAPIEFLPDTFLSSLVFELKESMGTGVICKGSIIDNT